MRKAPFFPHFFVAVYMRLVSPSEARLMDHTGVRIKEGGSVSRSCVGNLIRLASPSINVKLHCNNFVNPLCFLTGTGERKGAVSALGVNGNENLQSKPLERRRIFRILFVDGYMRLVSPFGGRIKEGGSVSNL